MNSKKINSKLGAWEDLAESLYDDSQLAILSQQDDSRLPNPETLQYYEGLKRREIWLDSELDESWLLYERYIIKWNRDDKDIPVEERTPIKLFFFSPGGDLDINNSFVDMIKLSKTPIYGYNMGICLSGGAFTFLACHKRFMLKHSRILLHSGSLQGLSGTASQVEQNVKDYNRQVEELGDFLVNDCGLDKKLVAKHKKDEWFLNAETAKSLNLIEEIITDIDCIL